MAEEKQYISFMDVENDTEELMGYNPEADANASLPPIPAGKYGVLVSFESEDPEKRWQQGVWPKSKPELQQKVVYTNLNVKLYNTGDEKIEGRTVREMVSSFIMRGTCSIQGVLQALGYQEQLKTHKTRGQLAALLNEALSTGEAYSEVEIEWEANEQLTDEERDALTKAGKREWRVQGMKRHFKQGEDGEYIPEIEHNGVMCRARNIVYRWITKSDDAQSAPEVQQQAPQQAAPRQAAPVSQQAPQAPHAPPQRTAPPAPPSGPPIPASARRSPPNPATVGAGRK